MSITANKFSPVSMHVSQIGGIKIPKCAQMLKVVGDLFSLNSSRIRSSVCVEVGRPDSMIYACAAIDYEDQETKPTISKAYLMANERKGTRSD
ncbi:MAG: hypothetical protein VR75_02525 [Hyphomonadaceae bacterium BRH_c29]|nr:MAG: hypothetical protein VR75_02525 [Hyphomonadaceae bacterium BRH_c29]